MCIIYYHDRKLSTATFAQPPPPIKLQLEEWRPPLLARGGCIIYRLKHSQLS